MRERKREREREYQILLLPTTTTWFTTSVSKLISHGNRVNFFILHVIGSSSSGFIQLTWKISMVHKSFVNIALPPIGNGGDNNFS